MNSTLRKFALAILLAFVVLGSAVADNSNDVGKRSSAQPLRSSPAASAAAAVFSQTFTFDTNTPTQADRVFRNGVPSGCGAKVYPGNFGSGTFRHVVSNAYTNAGADPVCLTVTLTTDATCAADVFATAYLGSFDVNNLGTNYLADSGSSIIGASQTESFAVSLPAGASVVFNINEAGASPGTTTCGFTLAAAPFTVTPVPTSNMRNLVWFGLGLLLVGLLVLSRRRT